MTIHNKTGWYQNFHEENKVYNGTKLKVFFWYKSFYPHTLSINNLMKKSRIPNICFRIRKQIFGTPDFIFFNYWSKKNVKKMFCTKQVLVQDRDNSFGRIFIRSLWIPKRIKSFRIKCFHDKERCKQLSDQYNQ